MVRFTMDLKSGKFKTVLEKELIQGERAGVLGTPTIFVNGKHYNGSMETAALEEIVQTELKSLSARATPSPRSR